MYIFFQFQGFEVTLCLYVPEDFTKEAKSIEMTFNLSHSHSIKLMRRGTMWERSMLLFKKPNELKYKYKIKMKKYFFSFSDEVVDQLERSLCWGFVQRDIFSMHKKHLDNEGKINGIVAHIEDILHDPKYKIEAAFHELDNINSRNSVNSTHWNGAFGKLLDGHFTENICLLFLYCMHKKYVTSTFLVNTTAVKIWATVKHIGKESRGICVAFVGEIFHIYEALGSLQCFPLHFINDMQSLLDISSLQKVLRSRPSYPIHDCKESLSCLKKALHFVLNQDLFSKVLYDMTCLIFDYIPEREILEGYIILNEFNVSDKQKDLKKMAQEHVIEKIKEILIAKISYLNFQAVNDILSITDDDFRCGLVQQCETEIIVCIRKTGGFGYTTPWKDLEHLCTEQLLFQTRDQQVTLLEAVMNLPSHDKSRDLIKYILMHFQTKESDDAKKTLEEAYDIVLETVPFVTSSEAKLRLCFEEYDALSEKMVFQIIRDHIEKSFRQSISKFPITSLLRIHADVENLHSATTDFYCQQLQEKLKTRAFQEKLDFLKTNCNKLNSRYN